MSIHSKLIFKPKYIFCPSDFLRWHSPTCEFVFFCCLKSESDFLVLSLAAAAHDIVYTVNVFLVTVSINHLFKIKISSLSFSLSCEHEDNVGNRVNVRWCDFFELSWVEEEFSSQDATKCGHWDSFVQKKKKSKKITCGVPHNHLWWQITLFLETAFSKTTKISSFNSSKLNETMNKAGSSYFFLLKDIFCHFWDSYAFQASETKWNE